MTAKHNPVAMARRLGWGVLDQGIASLSNFVVGIALAHTLGAEGFGAFTLAYVTFAMILNASRGVATDPLLVRFSGAPEQVWRRAVSASTATALAVGLVGGAGCLLFSLILPDRIQPVFVALAFCLPPMLVQDSWRFAFFAAGHPLRALANDMLWCGTLMLVLTGLHLTGQLSARNCVLALGATGVVTAFAGYLQSRVVPSIPAVSSWVVEHRFLGWRYLVENISRGAARQIMVFGLGGIAGLSAVGEVRAAEILMGPFIVILMGLSQVAVPEASHVIQWAPRRLLRFCLALAVGLAGTAALWGMLVWAVMPLGLGAFLLDELWVPASVLIPAVVVNVVAGGFVVGSMAGVRALGAARRSLRAQLTGASCYAGGGVLGAWIDGPHGACWGVAAGAVVTAAMWWYQLRRALEEHLAESMMHGQQTPTPPEGTMTCTDLRPPRRDEATLPP